MTLATGEEKTWQEKARSRTQRDALCEPARVPEWAQNANSPECRHTCRASLRSRNVCQDLEPLDTEIYRKLPCPRVQNADEHFVRACAVETHVKISQDSRNACQDFARATSYESSQENDATQNGAADSVRAGIVERHIEISLWAEATYRVDDFGNRRREDVTREGKK